MSMGVKSGFAVLVGLALATAAGCGGSGSSPVGEDEPVDQEASTGAWGRTDGDDDDGGERREADRDDREDGGSCGCPGDDDDDDREETPTPTPTPRPEPTPEVEEIDGRMTGGGSVFTAGGMRVTHGFQIRCDENDDPQRLQVNWGGGNRFHLLDMTEATCLDTELTEAPPPAGFDTYVGTGTGRYNGEEGATIELRFTDDGEPGVGDTATMTIRDADGNVVLEVSGMLHHGNHQAHRAN